MLSIDGSTQTGTKTAAKIIAAIEALEDHRAALSDEIVDTAVTPLKERLALLRKQEAAAQRQRKFISVMFLDLTNYTTLLRQMKPEEMLVFREGVMRKFQHIIETRGGRVLQFMGDGLFAVFGIPDVREDDAERAIRAGLDLLSAAIDFEQQVRSKWNLEGFGVRVGVDTGPVIVGGGIEAERSAFGMTVNLAARMEQTAPSGSLQITHDTFQQIYGLFDVEPQPPLIVKGREERLQTYLVLAARPRVFRMNRHGITGLEAPMIGRDQEFGNLCSLFEDTSQNRRAISITVIGEPGIGKSRLLLEFDQWITEQTDNDRVFRARGFRARQGSPYWLIRMLIANYCRVNDSDSQEILFHKLDTHMSRFIDEDSSKKTYLVGELLGYFFSGGQFIGVNQGDSQEWQEEALHYLHQFFAHIFMKGPATFLLEDVHWADKSSLEFLKNLEQSGRDLPLVILYLARPELLDSYPDWFKSRVIEGIRIARVELTSLPAVESKRLVHEILSDVDQIALPLVESISRRAEGNPLFVEELIKILVEDGVINRPENGRAWYIDKDKLGAFRVPPTLTAVMESRLDRLSRVEKRMIQMASIVGRTFWVGALERIGTEEGEIGPILNNLVGRDLVYGKDTSTFIGQAEYSFRHVLMRDVTYETMLTVDRSKNHEYVANWLSNLTEETGRQDEFSAVIAEHYDFGQRYEIASTWYSRAGAMARNQGALTEAIEFYDRVLELLPAESKHKRLPVMFAKENALEMLGEFEAQHDVLESVLRIANELDDENQLAMAYGRLGFCNRNLGRHSQEIEAYNTSIGFARSSGNKLVKALSSSLLAHTLLRLGNLESASRMADEALRAANELDDETYRAKALTNIGAYYSDSGDIAGAAKLFSELVAICSHLELSYGEAVNLSNLGYNYVLIGLAELAVPQLQQAISISESIGARQVEAYCQLNLGLAYYRMGETDNAQSFLEESLHASENYSDRNGQAYGNLYMGLTAEQRADHSSALEHFTQAMKLFDELGVPACSMDAKAGIARSRFGQNQHSEARKWTDTVWEYLSSLGSQGLEFPSLAYLTCVHNYINLNEEELSQSAEKAANSDLRERAERISDPQWRDSYENRIPEHKIFLRDN